MTLARTDFAAGFEALLGYAPYGWQARLFDEMMDERPIDALDLPTGLGKTSVIAIWLLVRAARGPVPRRLVYVVDRRAVVDQASEVARKLAERLAPESTVPVIRALRAGIELKSGGELAVSTLRGQHLDNQRWRENPGAPAIIVGTVDMIGSRLLFEGYGVSRNMRPAHAGLLGLDSLVVLDEAHLVPPFEALVRGVGAMAATWRPADAIDLPRALRVVSLSATGRETAGAFSLTPEDREDPQLLKRLMAAKRLTLEADATKSDIAARLAARAWEWGAGGRRVLVFANSRKTAQDVRASLDALQKAEKAFKGQVLTALLVGERRFRERERLAAERGPARESKAARNPEALVFARFKPGARPDPDARPAFLIATSAGEVGVDLDADDVVCDLVAWERMVQRLGRVNRRAEPGEARIAVIPVAKDPEAEDPIDDERIALLKAPFESPLWPDAAPPTEASPPGLPGAGKDASPLTLSRLKQIDGLRHALAAATTPEPLRPPLTRATIEAWSLTALDTHPGRPKVEPWLRGWVESEPQTKVVWRRLFPLRRGDKEITKDLKRFFEAAAPPHEWESRRRGAAQAPTC